jgi:hypothetical protein
MKKNLTLTLSAILFSVIAFAQPTRTWGTYFGGTADESAYQNSNNATDANGNVYICGTTYSLNGISTPGAYQTTPGGYEEAFLSKYNSAGVLQWSTYYGGGSNDLGLSVAVDAAGNVFLAGTSDSPSGIATPGAYQTVWASTWANPDAFLVKFNSAGVRQWGTYYGDDGLEDGICITVDASGNIYMTGTTGSIAGMATAGAFQTTEGGGVDGFIAKFSNAGVRLWGTFYGGSTSDNSHSITTDASGNVYIAGETSSTTGISSAGSHQPTNGGTFDAFLAKFNSSGVRQWGTYIGGTGYDEAYSVATDAAGYVYISGSTESPTGISTAGCYQFSYGGVNDAILEKFNSSGVRQWGTYFGGTSWDESNGITVDPSGKIYFTGYTESTNAISTAGAQQTSLGGLRDAYLSEFDNTGTIQASTYCGGPDDDYGFGVSSDASGKINISGITSSLTAISTAGSAQPIFAGGTHDAFLDQYVGGASSSTSATTGSVSPSTVCAGSPVSVPFTISGTFNAGNIFTAQLSNSSGSFASPVSIGTLSGTTAGTIPATIPANTTPTSSGYLIRVVASNPATIGSSSSITINATPAVSISGAASSYCINAGAVSLTGNPAGGTFSGSGMSGNLFTPASAGIGSHTITYSYTNSSGCSGTATVNINVNATPTVSFSGLNPSYILADPAATLTGSPAGGIFSGPGISGNTFSPSAAGVGTFTIVYIYNDGNGCMNAICESVTVTQFIGFEEHQADNGNEISILPNPSNGKFTLTFDGQNQAVKIRIVNVVGQIVHEENYDQYRGIYSKSIDLSAFADGVYSLTVEVNGELYQKSLIKQ